MIGKLSESVVPAIIISLLSSITIPDGKSMREPLKTAENNRSEPSSLNLLRITSSGVKHTPGKSCWWNIRSDGFLGKSRDHYEQLAENLSRDVSQQGS